MHAATLIFPSFDFINWHGTEVAKNRCGSKYVQLGQFSSLKISELCDKTKCFPVVYLMYGAYESIMNKLSPSGICLVPVCNINVDVGVYHKHLVMPACSKIHR